MMIKKFTLEEYGKLNEMGIDSDKLNVLLSIFYPDDEENEETKETTPAGVGDNGALDNINKQLVSITNMIQKQQINNSSAGAAAEKSSAELADEAIRQAMAPRER